jgi:hypothetical protein
MEYKQSWDENQFEMLNFKKNNSLSCQILF